MNMNNANESAVSTIFGHVAATDTNVEMCLNDPLYCGFLLKFCESEFNAENVRFILAVDGFRDMVLAHDPNTWSKAWTELDKEHLKNAKQEAESTPRQGDTGQSAIRSRRSSIMDPISIKLDEPTIDWKDAEWTSRLSRIDFDHAARYIWKEFLSDASSSQICLPASVAVNTKIRFELRHLYGPDIFNESCIDPIKTVKRDILPRFVVSPLVHFLEDHLRVESIDTKLTEQTLALVLPSNFRFEGKGPEFIAPDRLFELHEILDTGLLYYEFLMYLRASVTSENLLCVRMIDIYEDLISSPKMHDEAIEQAWRIYKSFIAPGAAYEISLNHLDRKDIMLRMANPNLVIFESAKKSAYLALRSKFENYRTTNDYKNLANVMREKLRKAQEDKTMLQAHTHPSPYACFGIKH
jgi:hypothetical protein